MSNSASRMLRFVRFFFICYTFFCTDLPIRPFGRKSRPVVVIGGKAGSFLGEYQAGGLILVLGIGQNGAYPVNNFCGTGMHGGKIVLRCDKAPTGLPPQVLVNEATEADMIHIAPYIKEYARHFGANAAELLAQKYFVLTPNPAAGYKQLYTFEA